MQKEIVTPTKQAITRPKQTDKTVNDNTASITNTAIYPLCNFPNNINLDNINGEVEKTMAINPDLSEPVSSKLLTTYQSPGQDMYQVTRPLVHLGAQVRVLHSHIPKQSEVNTFLRNV